MGWRGTLRTLGAVARQAERTSRAMQRIQECQEAAQVVQEYAQHMESIVSLHRCASTTVAWGRRASRPPPAPPVLSPVHEEKARRDLSRYQPSFFAKLFHRDTARISELEDAVTVARRQDEASHRAALEAYGKQLRDYEVEIEAARRVLAGDPASMLEVISREGPFKEIDGLGSKIGFDVVSGTRIAASVFLPGESVVPKDAARLLKTGRASVKPMPKTHYYRHYQDHVCSSALRVARELLALLPIEDAVITSLERVVSPTTGHLEDQPILSVWITRDTADQLAFETLDPSEAMRNFVHRMSFFPTTGFAEIVPLDPRRPGETT